MRSRQRAAWGRASCGRRRWILRWDLEAMRQTMDDRIVAAFYEEGGDVTAAQWARLLGGRDE